MITCRKCGEQAESSGQSGNICRPCYKAYQAAYRARNREALRTANQAWHAQKRSDAKWVEAERKRGREYWQNLRHEVILAYGGYRCSCCGITEPQFLTIDHVFNDGAAHRRSLGYNGNGDGASSRILKWLKDHGFPAGFQVLCMNCNMGKQRNGGICPHKTSASLENRVNSVKTQTG